VVQLRRGVDCSGGVQRGMLWSASVDPRLVNPAQHDTGERERRSALDSTFPHPGPVVLCVWSGHLPHPGGPYNSSPERNLSGKRENSGPYSVGSFNVSVNIRFTSSYPPI
jgi:hypothetical protein